MRRGNVSPRNSLRFFANFIAQVQGINILLNHWAPLSFLRQPRGE
jgi:hypothetical protein